jgi:hypothetical protein
MFGEAEVPETWPEIITDILHYTGGPKFPS